MEPRPYSRPENDFFVEAGRRSAAGFAGGVVRRLLTQAIDIHIE
jgi:hypothetical protein